MKSRYLLVLLFVLCLTAASAQAGGFDGRWDVTLETPEYKDPTGVTSLAYTFKFPAEVKDSVLHGEHGTKGEPAWLEITGTIGVDGNATLHAKGITGRPQYNLAHVATGRPYEYEVRAHFDGNHGTGSRIGGRISNYTFTKK
jgi:hypothetical protein